MTDQQHPITPPPELADKWGAMLEYCEETDVFSDIARWGADQELEACCEWLQDHHLWGARALLREERRPNPTNLKKQAHEALGRFFSNAHTQASEMTQDFEIIRRAVEALPND